MNEEIIEHNDEKNIENGKINNINENQNENENINININEDNKNNIYEENNKKENIKNSPNNYTFFP